MERNIEFRARSLSFDERWVFGSYLTRINSRGGREHFIVKEDGVEIAIDVETLGQYTGLIDVNEKKVYEGDTVDVYDTYRGCDCDGCNGCEETLICTQEVLWSSETGYFCNEDTGDYCPALGSDEVMLKIKK